MMWKVHNGRRSMSTALVYCGTSDGFVIGADGRAANPVTKQVESDTERKIFTFENETASVVFAWSGAVKAGTSDFVVSLLQETHDLLPRLDFNGVSFAEEFSGRLKDRLRILRTKDSGKCATGIFLSYRNGKPWISEICVFKNGSTWDCCVYAEDSPNGEIDVVSPHPFVPSVFEKPTSLIEATDVIKSYLDDCVAQPTAEIGGHVHIARFTHLGFGWIRPPV
ncbi:MAG TPA: hypothetical protein VGD60_11495 [Candidatus Acidoferrales bacterium]